MNFWSKRIKNKKELADALNIDESKIDALVNNELEIGGETMNKTLKAIEEERINKAIRDNDIWKWIQKTDFRQKRLEFGYKTIKEVASIIGVSDSTISRLETDKSVYPKLTPTLKKVYEFYQNEFNKKTTNITTKQNIDRSKKINKENNDIWKWYKNTDIKELRKQSGFKTGFDFASKIGVCASCVSDLETKKMKRVNRTMIKAYNYFNNEISTENNAFVVHQDEQLLVEPVVDACENTKNDEISILEVRIKQLELKNEQLEKQLTRYEKLIDRL